MDFLVDSNNKKLMKEEEWLAPKEPIWIYKNGIFHKAIVESINSDIIIGLLEDGSISQAKKASVYQRNPAYK